MTWFERYNDFIITSSARLGVESSVVLFFSLVIEVSWLQGRWLPRKEIVISLQALLPCLEGKHNVALVDHGKLRVT